MSLRISGLAGLLLGASVAFSAQAQDVAFTLINSSGVQLNEFYASPTNVDSWEEDILGNNVLPSGASGTVTIADGRATCEYDLLMVFADGQQLQDTVDICSMASYTIN